MTMTVYVAMIVLWCLVIALGFAVVALARQVGVIHQRLAPVGALVTNRELKVGERSMPFLLKALDGTSISIGDPAPNPRATLIMFVSSKCPVCTVLMPVLKDIAANSATWLRVVLVADESEAEMRRFQREKSTGDIPLAISSELGLAYRVSKLPYAVLLDEHSVITAHGLVNTRENLESLFEARRLGVSDLAEYQSKYAQSSA